MDKLTKKVQKDLLEGETILTSVKAAPKGILEGAILSGAIYSGTGVMVDSEKVGDTYKKEGEEERKSAGLDLGNHNQVIVGLTEKRVLIWSTKLFGAPKELLGAINRDDISKLERVNSKLLVANMPAIEFTLKSGGSFQLQVGKIASRKLNQLVEVFNK